MKEPFVTFAKHNRGANEAVYAILDKMSNDEREKERGVYYHSLSGLLRHIVGGSAFFFGQYAAALKDNAAASKALAGLDLNLPEPKDTITAEQWKDVQKKLKAADDAFVAMLEACSDADLKTPMTWFDGKTKVPLYFMVQQLVNHGQHHRGQISAVLDELKIENDFSGINPAFV